MCVSEKAPNGGCWVLVQPAPGPGSLDFILHVVASRGWNLTERQAYPDLCFEKTIILERRPKVGELRKGEKHIFPLLHIHYFLTDGTGIEPRNSCLRGKGSPVEQLHYFFCSG